MRMIFFKVSKTTYTSSRKKKTDFPVAVWWNEIKSMVKLSCQTPEMKKCSARMNCMKIANFILWTLLWKEQAGLSHPLSLIYTGIKIVMNLVYLGTILVLNSVVLRIFVGEGCRKCYIEKLDVKKKCIFVCCQGKIRDGWRDANDLIAPVTLYRWISMVSEATFCKDFITL